MLNQGSSASFIPLSPGQQQQQRSVTPVKGAGAPRHSAFANSAFLLLFVNSTLLALSTFLLVVLSAEEAQALATSKPAAQALAALPSVEGGIDLSAARVLPHDSAAQSFYDAHLTYIVNASHDEILALRNATAGPTFVAPKGRYQALASNATSRRRGRRKGGKGRGRRKGGILHNQTLGRRKGGNQTLGRRKGGNRTNLVY